MIKTQFRKSIKRLRSDNGKEYVNHDMSKFLPQNVVHEFTCVDTLQQNGIAERKNRHLFVVKQALLFQMNIPKSYLGEAVLTTTYLINQLPSWVLDGQSPIESVSSFFSYISFLSSLHIIIHVVESSILKLLNVYSLVMHLIKRNIFVTIL